MRKIRFSPPAILRSPTAPLSRFVFRAPLILYRIGLGWVLGHEVLVLTHVGRRTGRIRETVLKVLSYDPKSNESIVAAAWGQQSDWYRNIEAKGALAVRTARDWYAPEVRHLPVDEAFDVFEDWTRRQPRFSRIMMAQVGVSIGEAENDRRAAVARFPVLGLRPPPTIRTVTSHEVDTDAK